MFSSCKFPLALLLLLGLFFNPLSAQISFQKTMKVANASTEASKKLLTVSDGYIVAGFRRSNTINSRPCLFKISASGELLWLKNYGNGNNGEEFTDVIEANDGGFLAIGTSNGTNTFWNGAILIVKTDAEGNLQWEKIIPDYQTNGRNTGSRVIAVPDGYIISGNTTKDLTRAVLIHIDNEGETRWSKRYNGTFFENTRLNPFAFSGDTLFACGTRNTLASFAMFSAASGEALNHTMLDGEFPGDEYLPWMTEAPNGDFLLSGYASIATGTAQWVCRLNRSGELKWSKIYPGVGWGAIIPMADDQYVLVLNTTNNFPSNRPALMKIDAEGEVIWCYRYGGNSYEWLTSAVEMPDGGVMAIGGKQQQSISEHLLIRTDANGLIAGCCRNPLSTQAQPYGVTFIPLPLNSIDFENVLSTEMIEDEDTLGSQDYCESPSPLRLIDLTLCAGDTLFINGTAYTDSATVTSLVPGPDCDTTIYYTIHLGNSPLREETIAFCAGDTVFIGGTAYTQPATFTLPVPSLSGSCDTLVTYILEYQAGTSMISLECPADISIVLPAGASSVPINYDVPTFQSDCTCPGNTLLQVEGPANGSNVSAGTHTVCFESADQCGTQNSCCFQVHVTAEETDEACDVKVNACVRFELLGITRDAHFRRSYHIRVQNNCAQSLSYVAFQLPDGLKAYGLPDNSNWLSPGGHNYTVRNPNHSPFHSIRFSALDGGLQSNASETFSYTLAPGVAPDFIQALVKPAGAPAIAVHLNTFYCPIEFKPSSADRSADALYAPADVSIYPNPASDVLTLDLSAWPDVATRVRIFNAQGQLVSEQTTEEPERLTLLLNLPGGVYALELGDLAGKEKLLRRFVLR